MSERAYLLVVANKFAQLPSVRSTGGGGWRRWRWPGEEEEIRARDYLRSDSARESHELTASLVLTRERALTSQICEQRR